MNVKVPIRNIRNALIYRNKKLKKDGESEDVIKRLDDSIQKIIDKAIVDIEGIINNKKNDIMKIYGVMSEWFKEHAWKACIQKCIEGSNPSYSA